jgi:TonB family protein
MNRVVIVAAIAAAQTCFSTGAVSVADPAPRIAVAETAGAPCSAYAGHLEPLDAAGSRYAVALFTHDRTRAFSGVLALYRGDDRYDVRFTNAIAADPRDDAAMPTPLVVRIDPPATIEAAVVTSLDGKPCAPMNDPVRPPGTVTPRIGSTLVGVRPHQRFGPPPSNPGDAFWQRFHSAAESAPVLVPDAVVHEDRVACAHPDRPATTAFVAAGYGVLDADALGRGAGGQAIVLLTLDDKDNVVSSRIERASGSPDVDRAALAIVAHSQFRSPLFHCRAYGGSFLFSTDLR